jgi:hypothetical protein
MANDWNAEAANAARVVNEHLFEAHRGALQWDRNVVAIFGNDGWAEDACTKRQVELLREKLRELQVVELGFGTASDGYSWALLILSDGYAFDPHMDWGERQTLAERFANLTWDAWARARREASDADGARIITFMRVQQQKAQQALKDYPDA